MMVIVYCSLLALLLACIVLQVIAHRTRTDPTIGNNPQFLKFQRGYFAVYLLAMFADWLQGPYLYQLYSYYGFQEEQIAVLYVFGFASTVIIGMWAPLAADQFGRKKLCLLFTVLYSLSCFLKLTRSYGILILGRIIGGVATSVLFSAFEAWYVHEHIETHDFPKEWISVTFSKASTWNGVLAVTAGMVTNVVSETFGLGPVAPYMLAVPFLIFAGILVSTHWVENYSGSKVKFKRACTDGFKGIMSKEIIFMIGAIEALFESVIYIVIFLWTPVLQPGKPALGVVFACFMLCILSGQAVFQILSSRRIEVPYLLIVSCGVALFANIICVFSTNPANRMDTNYSVSFVAFLIFQCAVGMYFPAMGYLRSRIIPDQHRWSIMNWFRVPINLISCIVLMLLHEDAFQHGNRMIFVICSVLLSLSVLFGVRLHKLAKEEESLKEEKILMASEHIHNIF
ncbi:molybdate-anion transporter-like [Mya arenaria]|uniref:molybdate-anion transporter-like n=1 Tax=Mya arenaria TaxID=6604 RepID=UPI0022E0C5C8|nr:molybdate-anion transporter-like [Mya arenaria]